MTLGELLNEAERLGGEDRLAEANALYAQWLDDPAHQADPNARFVVHHNQALLQLKLGLGAQAVASLLAAVQAAPFQAESQDALLSACLAAGLPSVALAHLARSLLNPAADEMQSRLYSRLQQLTQQVPHSGQVHWVLDTGMPPAEVATRLAEKLLPQFNHRMAAPQRHPGHDRLRVGYLVREPEALPLPARSHDRSRVEVRVYCWSLAASALERGAPLEGVDAAYPIADLSDDAAAVLIRSHEIDVLIDLHGGAVDGRPGVLIYRPAPVQLSWTDLGLSTAMPTEDGCVGHGEWLPPAGLPWLPPMQAQASPGAEAGLGVAVHMTAASGTAPVVNTLLRVMAPFAGSRLVLLGAETGLVNRLRELGAAVGLAAERIAVQDGWAGVDLYVELPASRQPRRVLDALAHGLPVVAVASPAVDWLRALGLAESAVASDLDDVVRLATQALAQRQAGVAPALPDAERWQASTVTPWTAWWEARLNAAVAALPLRPAALAATPQDLAELPDLHAFTLPGPEGQPFRRRYVIAAPPHEHNSAGIRVLYDLQKWLVRAGYDAVVCTYSKDYPVEQFRDDIVIYPEVAPGNLLCATRVVRFVMNVPGKLGRGLRQYDANEFLVAYNKHLAPYADGRVLQVPSVEPWFHDPGPDSQRDVDAFYVGKGRNSGKHPEHCVEITRSWPPSRREVAALLRRCRTLYTYDNFTMMVPEAQLCGCETLLVHPDGSTTPVVTERLTSAEEFRHQLHAFIVETQRL